MYIYAVEAADTDGDALIYSLTTAPAGMAIDPSSRLISWTPAVGQAGTYNIIVQVDDSRGGIASQSFDVIVNVAVPNVAPTITSAPVFSAKSGFEYQYPIILAHGIRCTNASTIGHQKIN